MEHRELEIIRENSGKYIDLRNLWKAEVMESRTNIQKKTEGHGYVNSHSGIHRWDEELAMIGGRQLTKP